AELAGILRQGAVQELHRSAARQQRARRQRRRAAHVHRHAAGRRRRCVAGVARTDTQQRAASHASLRPLMTISRLLAVAMLLAAAHSAHAEYILSLPDGAARAGAPLRADLTILNDSDAPLRVE